MTISMYALIGLVIFMLGVLVGSRISDRQAKPHLKKTYEDGLHKGYELGWMMKRIDLTNKGFVISGKVNEQVKQILKGKGVN